MNRFIWLMRREVWEHKAIWIAPLIVLGCMLAFPMLVQVHLGPFGEIEGLSALKGISHEAQTVMLAMAHTGLTVAMFVVLGIISIFYSLDSLYADRRDRSVLFWKSMPLSDAETVLSKFAVAAVLIPLVAVASAVASHFLVSAAVSLKLSIAGMPAGFLWNAQAFAGGILVSLLFSVMAMLWYAPVVGYLMLASAWAPRAPFLWAVLPPVGVWLLERVLLYTEFTGDFIARRLLGPIRVLEVDGEGDPKTGADVREALEKLADHDQTAILSELFLSAELWIGVAVAGLLIAAAIWLRRYRDETS
jgi:ABC-2 type transport system permease protein